MLAAVLEEILKALVTGIGSGGRPSDPPLPPRPAPLPADATIVRVSVAIDLARMDVREEVDRLAAHPATPRTVGRALAAQLAVARHAWTHVGVRVGDRALTRGTEPPGPPVRGEPYRHGPVDDRRFALVALELAARPAPIALTPVVDDDGLTRVLAALYACEAEVFEVIARCYPPVRQRWLTEHMLLARHRDPPLLALDDHSGGR